MKDAILDIAADDRTGAVTAAGTIGVSISAILDIIPDNIGNLGVLMGIVLTTILCIVHIRKEIRSTKAFNVREKKFKRGLGNYEDAGD